MLADRRIREMKEMIEAGRVIPDEFQVMAREIMADPDAETLVASLVDAFLTSKPLAEQPGEGSRGSRHRDDHGPSDRPPRPEGARPAGGGGRRRGGGGPGASRP